MKTIHSMHQRLVGLTTLLLFVTSLGCSSGNGEIERYAIDGTVTYEGQPVPYGTISLIPDADQGNSGPGSTGIIEEGKFQIPANRGIVGGPYRATINGQKTRPEQVGEGPPNAEVLFEQYEVSIKLPAESTTQAFEIPGQSTAPKTRR